MQRTITVALMAVTTAFISGYASAQGGAAAAPGGVPNASGFLQDYTRLTPVPGKDGRYAVVWADAYYFGSQGYGMINELERRGFDAGAYPTYRVPVTQQRIILPGAATAEVVLATGVNVAVWRATPGAVEVADVEPRDAGELVEFERLRTEAIDALNGADLPDVAALVDTNLFLASTDPRLPAGVEGRLTRMLELGEETAVFIAPPGTFG